MQRTRTNRTPSQLPFINTVYNLHITAVRYDTAIFEQYFLCSDYTLSIQSEYLTLSEEFLSRIITKGPNKRRSYLSCFVEKTQISISLREARALTYS